MNPRGLKFAGLAIIAVPAGLLFAFTIGETLDGDLSGLQHLGEVIPLIGLVVLGWYRPALAGAILLAVGLALAAAYALWFRPGALDPVAVAATGALLFLPPVLAGALLIASDRLSRRRPQPSR